MSNTSASFHAITSVSVKYAELAGGSGCLMFTFRDSSGGYHYVTAHVERPLEIVGAEFVNLLAAHEKEATK